MRLWRLTGDLRTTHGKPSATGTFSDFVNAYDPPQEMLYSTKEGAGDFFLRAHDNPLLNSSAAVGLRNFSVSANFLNDETLAPMKTALWFAGAGRAGRIPPVRRVGIAVNLDAVMG